MRPRATKRQRPEAKIQMQIVEALALVLLPGSIVHASLNEEASPVMRMINAAMGARAGFSDLLVVTCGIHFYLEVKTRTGSQSEDQRAFERDVTGQGHPYYVVRSVDDVLAVLRRHNVRTRIVSSDGVPWARIRLEPLPKGIRACP